MTSMKNIIRIDHPKNTHWVGDGFPVTTMLSYNVDGYEINPFLLLDYAGPTNFEPSDHPRGVGYHPHRGFETVTIVYQGEVEHHDNQGNSGVIGVGDVQWMTAARGILHEEMHSREFTRKGGTLEMIQLWVNLPAKYKMSEPHYQEILSQNIPVIDLPENAGCIRLIAGNIDNKIGIARTFTPINLWDIRLNAGHTTSLNIPEGHHAVLLVLSGNVIVNDIEPLKSRELILLTYHGDTVSLDILEDSIVLLISGEPIDEPIIGHGPYVMNTHEEIQTAKADYAAGRF